MPIKQREMLPVEQRNASIFASRLRIALQASGLSQASLAKKIDITPQMVSHYCLGNNVPQLSMLATIAQELGVSSDYLLGLAENESVLPEVRSIGDYTGLKTSCIETLHKYRTVPLFTDTVNFLLTNLEFLERIADFLTVPLLNAVTKPPYNHINLVQPVHDKLSTLQAIELHDCAITAQKDFAAANAENDKLQEYVADRYVAKYSTGSCSCNTPQHTHTYSPYDMLHSICESDSLTEYEKFVQELDFFSISDIRHVNSIKAAEKSVTTDSGPSEAG